VAPPFCSRFVRSAPSAGRVSLCLQRQVRVVLDAMVDDCGSSNYTSSLVSATSQSLLKLDQAHMIACSSSSYYMYMYMYSKQQLNRQPNGERKPILELELELELEVQVTT
jgi:hypothetical protein